MFRQIQMDLGQGFYIKTNKEAADVEIVITKDQQVIGGARLTTDNIDVSCVTAISLDSPYHNHEFNQKVTLGEILIKFLLKFPSVVRKPEFRFILNVPDTLKLAVAKYHRGEDSSLEPKIMIRTDQVLPEFKPPRTNITLMQSIADEDLEKLLLFLKKNAPWQKNLTGDRLKILLQSSQCFFAMSDTNELVGFARVVTDNKTFASLWDVAVNEEHRRKGIGMSLMQVIFTHKTLRQINNWVLYTEDMQGLYQKFGFVSEENIPNSKLVHKLRLQEEQPEFMPGLIQTASDISSISLNPDQAFQFLFGNPGKRRNLSRFWQEVGAIPALTQPTNEASSATRLTC